MIYIIYWVSGSRLDKSEECIILDIFDYKHSDACPEVYYMSRVFYMHVVSLILEFAYKMLKRCNR